MGPESTQHLEEFEQLLIWSRNSGLESNQQEEIRRADHTSPRTGRKIIRICVWTSERETNYRVADPSTQLNDTPGMVIIIIGKGI